MAIAGTLRTVTLPSSCSVASTTPTGVSMRCTPGPMRPRWASDDDEPDGAVAAHAEIADVVEEDHAGRARRVVRLAQQRADHHVRAARLVDDARAEVVEAACGTRRAVRASVPPPRSGPPATTRRVGSPPVCESMMSKVFMMLMVGTAAVGVLVCLRVDCDDFGIVCAMLRDLTR